MAPSDSRESWIDIAKAGAILLVALLHSTEVLIGLGLGSQVWREAVDSLQTVRMPTFFLISGLFAARSLTTPARAFRTGKVWNFLWVYALWSVLYIAVYAAQAAVTGASVGLGVGQWILHSLIGDTALWYLAALPVFFVAARLLRPVPVLVQLIVAGALSAVFASGLVVTNLWAVDHMPMYVVYFLVGCHFSSTVRTYSPRLGLLGVLVLGAAWFAGRAGLDLVGAKPVGQVILPLLAVPCALGAAATLGRTRLRAPLAWLGRHTLPVYVLHNVAIVVIVVTLHQTLTVPDGSPLLLVLPPVVALASTAIALLIWLAVRNRAPWLFALPDAAARPGPDRAAPGTGADIPRQSATGQPPSEHPDSAPRPHPEQPDRKNDRRERWVARASDITRSR